MITAVKMLFTSKTKSAILFYTFLILNHLHTFNFKPKSAFEEQKV